MLQDLGKLGADLTSVATSSMGATLLMNARILSRLPISRIRVHLESLDNGDCALPEENPEKNESFSVT